MFSDITTLFSKKLYYTAQGVYAKQKSVSVVSVYKTLKSVSSKPFVCNNCHVQAFMGISRLPTLIISYHLIFCLLNNVNIICLYKSLYTIAIKILPSLQQDMNICSRIIYMCNFEYTINAETMITFIKYNFVKCCTKIFGKGEKIDYGAYLQIGFALLFVP